MKRKATSAFQGAFQSGYTLASMARLYKRRKTAPTKKTYKKMAYGKRYKRSGFTTTQQDVKTSKPKKYNKVKARKQQAFANKIQKALQPRQELNVYSEVAPASVSVKPIGTQVKQQVLSAPGLLMMNTGKLFSTSVNTGFIMGRYQNLITSNNGTVLPGVKSQIPNNEFQLQMTNTYMDLSISNPSVNTAPTIYDVWEFVAARDIADTNYRNPQIAWQTCLTENYSPTDTTSRRPVVTDNGQTPYDCPQLGRYWKILKKTRLYLAPNTTAEYTMNCGKFTLHGDKFQTNHAIAGITKGIVIVAGVGDNSEWPEGEVTVLRYVENKTWHFKYHLGESELPQRPTNLMRVL